MKKLMTVAVVLGVGALAAHASDWSGAVSSDWADAGNWSAGVPVGDNTGIMSDGANAPTISADASVNDLFLGWAGNSATLTQTAGNFTGSWMAIGKWDSGTTGTYNLTGSGSATALRWIIGDAGTAGGTVTVDTTGSLTGHGYDGWTDWQTANDIVIGNSLEAGGSSTLNLVNGTVNANSAGVWVGRWWSQGTLNQSGGTLNTVDLKLGVHGDSTGTVNMTGGELNAGHISIADAGGATDVANGSMSVENATVNTTGDLVIGNGGQGAADLTINSGGVVNVGDGSAEKWLIMGNGDTVDSSLTVNAGGTLNLNGGSDLMAWGVNGNTGTKTITVDGGTIQGSAGSILSLSADGTLNIVNGGTVDIETINNSGTINGDLTLGAGKMIQFNAAESLTVSGLVTLDDSFGVASLMGFGTNVVDGTYTLINNASDFSNIQNFGIENAYTMEDGRLAYFQNGSLDLVIAPAVIPEPATIGLIGVFGAGLLFVRRRFMI